MRQSKEPNKESTGKLSDFIKAIKATEGILKLESTGKGSLRLFIKELRTILSPYKNLSGDTFLEILRHSLSEIDSRQLQMLNERLPIQFDIESIPLEELKDTLSKNTFTKEQLLQIGEKRFSLSKGTLRKSRKEEVLNEILSAIRNIETLDAIKRKAAE